MRRSIHSYCPCGEMKYVTNVKDGQELKSAAIQELKKHGVKIPKLRNGSSKLENRCTKVFGTCLASLPVTTVDVEKRMKIPEFLELIVSHIEKNVEAEGLFRKAGSLSRQREIRRAIESGCADLKSAVVFDLANIVKQFLRELPEPLITTRLHDAFLKVQGLENGRVKLHCILLLCLLLPVEHIHVLRYIMMFLMRIASFSDRNKMTVHNLAVIMTPNLMHHNEKSDKVNKILQSETEIVALLITHSNQIGIIPAAVVEKLSGGSQTRESEEELEKSSSNENLLESAKAKKKRRRSINGVLNQLRRRAGQQSAVVEQKDSEVPLTVIQSFLELPETPCSDRIIVRLERSSSKRKAPNDSSLTPPLKKRAILAECCDSSYFTPVGQTTDDEIFNKSQKYPDAALLSENVNFVAGAPSFNFTDGKQIFSSAATSEEDRFKTPKIIPKYKRFFSPGRLLKRRNGSSAKSKRKQAANNAESNQCSDAIGRRLSGGEIPKWKFAPLERSSVTFHTLVDTFVDMDLNESKLAERHPKASVASEISFGTAGKPETTPSVENEKKEESQKLNNSYELRSRRSVSEANLPYGLVDSVKIQRSKNSLRKVGSFCVRDRNKRVGLLKASSPFGTSPALNRQNTALRRGRPNTVRTGLPTTPFKLPNEQDVSTTNVAAKNLSFGSICSVEAFSESALSIGHETNYKMECSAIAVDTPSYLVDESSCECLPVIVFDATPMPKKSVQRQFTEMFVDQESINVDPQDKCLDDAEDSPLFKDNKSCSDEKMLDVILADESNFEIIKENEKGFESPMDCGIPIKETDRRRPKPVLRRSARLSLSQSNIGTDDKVDSLHRQLSGSEILRHNGALIAPLTTTTYETLSRSGVITIEDDVFPVDSTELELVWKPAGTVIGKDACNDVIPNYSRPSLIRLKTERAGMVSASVQKYNAIHRMTSPAVAGGAGTPQKNAKPPAFIRGVQGKVGPGNEPNLPVTNYIRRQSIRAGVARSCSSNGSPKTPPVSDLSSSSSPLRTSSSDSSLNGKRAPLVDRNSHVTQKHLLASSERTKTPVFKPPLNPSGRTPLRVTNRSAEKPKGEKKPVRINQRPRQLQH